MVVAWLLKAFVNGIVEDSRRSSGNSGKGSVKVGKGSVQQ